MEQLTGGLSSEIYRLDASTVVRFAPTGPGIFPEYDLALQARVQQHVAAGGVPVPAPAVVRPDPTGRLGMQMPFVAGRIPGPVPYLDPWIAEMPEPEQTRLYTNVLDVLAAIHRIEPPPDLAPRDDLACWADYLDWSEAVPDRLRRAFEWCRANAPDATAPPVLLWGDARLGNVVFDDDGSILAVLDWEMASVGAAEHDVAWLFALESLQDDLFGKRVPGFPVRADARAHYEARAGRTLHALEWYEAFALVRSTAIMARLQHIEGKPVAADPLLDVLEERIASQQ
ncbi:MAG: phosphotransferase family protein [Acidimicrobiia bacterium]